MLRAATHTSLNTVTVDFELTLNWDDKLGNNGEHFGTTLLEHIEDTLDGEETVGILLFTDTLEEDGEVVMVVELHDIDFPEDSVLGSVLDRDGEITTIIEASELRGDDSTTVNGTGDGLLNNWLGDGFQKGSSLSTKTFTFLKGC